MNTLPGRIRAIIWALVVTAVISLLGAGVWTILITTNLAASPAIPWAVPAMVAVLWAMWQYLSGRWWPSSTSRARRLYLRTNPVRGPMLAWALAASILSLIALVGLWIVLVELTGVGGNPTIPDYSRYPRLTVILGLLMGSLVSPLTEEAAFRGYAQVKLGLVFPAGVAVAIASALFAMWHGPTQGFVWSKLLFYFAVGLAFGTTAQLTNSILPTIPVHILGDATFFFLIWPYDAGRPVVWRDGADIWFWLALAVLVVFGTLTILAFKRLAKMQASKDRGNSSIR